MSPLRYTLLTDGSSDAVLRHPIEWIAIQSGLALLDGQWADLRMLPDPPRSLPERIKASLRLYPCDILLVHRDAEREPRSNRITEIESAMARVEAHPPLVCVVPVRMTDAWLLHDEAAIRMAAGNPNGTAELPTLPQVGEAESLADPKHILSEALLEATGHLGQRRQRARRDFGRMRRRLAELIDDYAPLRQLPAFATFEEDLLSVLRQHSELR